jgi:hypothetical protein
MMATLKLVCDGAEMHSGLIKHLQEGLEEEGGEFRAFIPTMLRLEGGRQTWGWWPWKLEDTGVKIEKVIPQSEITLLSEFQKVYDSVGRRVGMW